MICFVHVATFGIGVRSFGNDQASSNISPPRLQRSGAASSWHLLWSLRSVRPINCSRDFKSMLIYSIYSNSDLNCIYIYILYIYNYTLVWFYCFRTREKMEIKQTTCRKQRFNLLGQHMIWQLQKHRHCRSNFLQTIAHGVNVHHNICLVYTKCNALSYVITSYKFSLFLGGLSLYMAWWCLVHFLSTTAPLLTKVVYAYSHCISYLAADRRNSNASWNLFQPVPTCSNNHFFQRICTWVYWPKTSAHVPTFAGVSFLARRMASPTWSWNHMKPKTTFSADSN